MQKSSGASVSPRDEKKQTERLSEGKNDWAFDQLGALQYSAQNPSAVPRLSCRKRGHQAILSIHPVPTPHTCCSAQPYSRQCACCPPLPSRRAPAGRQAASHCAPVLCYKRTQQDEGSQQTTSTCAPQTGTRQTGPSGSVCQETCWPRKTAMCCAQGHTTLLFAHCCQYGTHWTRQEPRQTGPAHQHVLPCLQGAVACTNKQAQEMEATHSCKYRLCFLLLEKQATLCARS